MNSETKLIELMECWVLLTDNMEYPIDGSYKDCLPSAKEIADMRNKVEKSINRKLEQ